MKHYLIIEVREPVNDAGQVGSRAARDAGVLRGLIHTLIEDSGFDCATVIVRGDRTYARNGRLEQTAAVERAFETYLQPPFTP